MYSKSIELYGDGIGRVDYVNHMGDDLIRCREGRIRWKRQKTH
jgi:hypothetical protein